MSEIDRLVDQLKNRKIDRRQFIIKGAALGVSLTTLGGILAACGGGTATPAATETATAAATETATAAATETATATAAATETATAAATETAATGEQVTLKYWKSPHSEFEQERWGKIIADFEAANPGIKIEHTITSWETWDETYTAAFAGGDPPDVSYMPDQYYLKFAAAKQLADLGPFVNDSSYASEKSAWFEDSWKSGQFDGVQIAIPSVATCTFIYYNKDLFAQAGLSEPPKTREELVAAAQKIKALGDDIWGYSGATSAADSGDFFYFQYFHDDGADFLNEDWSANGFNNEAGLSAAKFVASLYCDLKVAPPAGSYNRPGLLDLFRGGKVGMMMEEVSQHGDFKNKGLPFQYDIFLQPGGKVKQTSFGNYGYFTMAEDSKNKDAAWKFIAYVTSAPVIGNIAEQQGFALMRGDYPMFKDDPIYAKMQSEIAPKVQGFNLHPKIREVLTALMSEMEGVLGCQQSPEDGLKKAGDAVDQILQEG